MKRKQTLPELPQHLRAIYKDLKSVEGKVVGYVCVECGRLSTAPHAEGCSRAEAELEG